MTQVATTKTVFGEFDGRELDWPGGSCRVLRRGDQFWVEMDDPDESLTGVEKRIERPVVMTTGSHHMQVYWYPIGKQRSLGQVLTDLRTVPWFDGFTQPQALGIGGDEWIFISPRGSVVCVTVGCPIRSRVKAASRAIWFRCLHVDGQFLAGRNDPCFWEGVYRVNGVTLLF